MHRASAPPLQGDGDGFAHCIALTRSPRLSVASVTPVGGTDVEL